MYSERRMYNSEQLIELEYSQHSYCYIRKNMIYLGGEWDRKNE